MSNRLRRRTLPGCAIVGVVVCASVGAAGQQPVLDRIRDLPGYYQYSRMQEQLRQPALVTGALSVTWAADSRSFTYVSGGRRLRFDLGTRIIQTVADPATPSPAGAARGGGPARGAGASTAAGPNPCPAAFVDRGRQRSCEGSPDGQHRAFYEDRNVFVSAADGSALVAVTRDGSVSDRIKNGTASWVYGEELDQTTAIWWSPDSRRVAFYRFDERQVGDYYVSLAQTSVQSRVDVEAYPKAGSPNPVADVLVYDLASRRTVTLDVRSGQPWSDEVVGHYVYGMTWASDGGELRMFRTDRRQQTLEYVGCSPETARCRTIIREHWPTGWVDNHPVVRPVAGGARFLWSSERSGWRNYYLYDSSGKLLHPVTTLSGAEADAVVRVDDAGGSLYYMARDGDNRLKLQLHRARLDGTGDVRLTDPRFHHTVTLAPDGNHFLDVYQTHDQPPASRVVDRNGRVLAEVAQSDLTLFDALELKKVEMFSYVAGEGETSLHGTIAFPSTFDPAKRYPVLIPAYGGPETSQDAPSEVFPNPSATPEYGFLVVRLGTRANPGVGRRAFDSIYLKLGQAEVDDLAAGVRALTARPYVDRGRVGIYGTSYGGYVSIMGLLRYPDVFSAASASSPVTDWRNYDTIYTERYMWTPAGNADGYAKGAAATYAANLRGRLLIYYGTADNNVHPSNSLQLVAALNRAGKSYEVQVGPDAGHTAVPMFRMMEFFIENLVVHPDRLLARPPA